MNELIERHNLILRELISQTNIPAQRINDAILYSLFPGGKRIRPLLVYLCGELIHVQQETLDIIAAAIELTHCYSLIHDDLPAMDNDDFRRGKPSCHRAFDEATAILVGDGLQALAIDILLKHLPKTISPRHVLNVTHELIQASGVQGMISGQSLDLSELAHQTINEAVLCNIHHLKTGKLILACVNMVLNAISPTPEETHALQTFAYHLGIAFQMQDDYLDHYDKGAQLGKNRASDLANNKITFATLYNEETLLIKINTHFNEAFCALNYFKELANKLNELLKSLQLRTVKVSFQHTQKEN